MSCLAENSDASAALCAAWLTSGNAAPAGLGLGLGLGLVFGIRECSS